ncbi:hypothetical protein RB628_26140 [Streptomyces sp. ADMS]|uniref:hypothetical protein n=1 Tax=Streptomyces sp. ADMS TaxID=3071415 RepID=UPI00296F53D7|nr:hypothetical protein [Streptomyces sp. ADMS]MDW4908723.1 hypothetical protein [Streptomyces sp. ADMS]
MTHRTISARLTVGRGLTHPPVTCRTKSQQPYNLSTADLDPYTVWRGTTVDGVCTDTDKPGYTAVARTPYQNVNVADGGTSGTSSGPPTSPGTSVRASRSTSPSTTCGHGGTPGRGHPRGRGVVLRARQCAVARLDTRGHGRRAGLLGAVWNPETAAFEAVPDTEPLHDANVPKGTSLCYQVVGVREDGTTSLPVLVSVAVPPVS